ncbi:hypothetical protein MANES_13G113450v8 [Manihot esculenta]|uniref:Uncharacterized protein n=1 Tax=Manihot esculenta TaxID=3983 RepID=A0ACB7GN94_MANES|nr:hypothetical protein MANES_13G113450v8 [Manihot esculenta]
MFQDMEYSRFLLGFARASAVESSGICLVKLNYEDRIRFRLFINWEMI